MLRKNDYCDIEITDLGHKGEGIGRYKDFVIFADNCLPGDTCRVKILKVKKSYAYGKAERIISPSPDRVPPACPVAEKCGGCSLMHMAYPAQLQWKQRKVQEALRRIGGIENPNIEPIGPMENPAGYRNKVQVPVREENGRIKIGYYAKNSHRIVENPGCYIQDKAVGEIIQIVRDYMDDFHISAYNEESGKGLIRHIIVKSAFGTGQVMTVVVLNARDMQLLPEHESLCGKLSAVNGMKSIFFNYNNKPTNVILGSHNRLIWGDPYITDRLGTLNLNISPHSFYQVNPAQALKMYETAVDFADVQAGNVVIDAYCGIGAISLFFARKARLVYGMEIVGQAVLDAEANARANGLHHVVFMEGRAEELISSFKNAGREIDIIVADPPRKGCDVEFLKAVAGICPQKFVYISCNPDTLARDLAHMAAYGYQMTKAKPFDMFCYSTHVETVALLERTHE